MDIPLMSFVRAAHILTAALWLGSAALLTLFVMPSIRRSGASGGAVIAETMRSGLGIFMASVAGLAVLSGLWMYWFWLHARGPDAMHSAAAIALALGAFAGVAAAIIGGGVLGRTSRELADLAALPVDAAAKSRIDVLHRRGALASRIVLTLLVAALLLMIFSRSL